MRWGSRAIAVGLVTVVAACGASSLPTVPSELTSGVAIYEHADYAGESALLTEDVKDLKEVKGPCAMEDGENTVDRWNDCISSIRVAPGWRATLFRDDGFKGEQFEVSGDVPNLQQVTGGCSKGGFNDCVTAIRVFRP